MPLRLTGLLFRFEGALPRAWQFLPAASRTLRISEQARASNSLMKLIPSYKEPTVNALAPITEEGRG